MEQPFFWQERDGWYLNQRSASGKRSRVRLADTKKAAFEKWRAMLARQKPSEIPLVRFSLAPH